jgi:hypothetical protein
MRNRFAHQVATGDNPHDPAAVDDGEVAYAMTLHELQTVAEAIGGRHRDDL